MPLNRPAALIAILACHLAAAASAGPGIEFDRMPVGCSWIVEYSNGNRWLETYIGKKGRSHVVRTVEAESRRSLVKTSTFNAEGLLTRRSWAGGKWEKFSPHSCFGIPGTCRYSFSNADGMKKTIEDNTVRKGETYIVRSGFVGGERFPEEQFHLGPYGVMVLNKAPNYSARTTRFVNCELESS